MNAADILNQADVLLVEHGWRQGCADESVQALTLREAVFLAVTGGEWRKLTAEESSLFRYAAWFLVQEMPADGPRMLSTWNDWPGRSFGEVRNLIAAAVKAAEWRRWNQRLTAVAGGRGGVVTAEPRQWTLVIAAPTEMRRVKKQGAVPALRPTAGWLTMNDRRHWSSEHMLKQQWADSTRWAAKQVKLHKVRLQRAQFAADLLFANPARRDTSNWHPTVKVVIDTLVRMGLLPDDEPLKHLHCEQCPHLTKNPQRLPAGPLKPLGMLVLTITDLSEVAP